MYRKKSYFLDCQEELMPFIAPFYGQWDYLQSQWEDNNLLVTTDERIVSSWQFHFPLFLFWYLPERCDKANQTDYHSGFCIAAIQFLCLYLFHFHKIPSISALLSAILMFCVPLSLASILASMRLTVFSWMDILLSKKELINSLMPPNLNVGCSL